MKVGSNGMCRMLVVEDNQGDVVLLQEAIGDAALNVKMHVARDGVEAVEWLDANAPPDVMVLDLNLPRLNGRDVLRHVAAQNRLKELPVAVLTTSEGERNICDEFRQLRCLFNVKVADYHKMIRTVREIVDFACGDGNASCHR